MKYFKIPFTIAILLATLVISACKKGDDPSGNLNQPLAENLFTNCGKIPPVLACIYGAKVFVPNAFSPNSDGFNDKFLVFAGEGINKINLFQIFDESGNIVFENHNFWPNDASEGWDGKLPDESLNNGLYNYVVVFSNTLDEFGTFEGAVCLRTSTPVDCVEHEKHIAWGTQHDGNGGFDFNLPSYENCE